MAGERVQRRLAAILAADVAGYSRLMGSDDEGTLAGLKACRELIDVKSKEHRGRIVNTPGDSALVEFASAVDATRCAMEIQKEMAERNAVIPEERRIEFRIGINVGDVIVDDRGDIYGDGVNIAARVESLAQPGALCLSDEAYRQIKGKLAIDASDMGEHQLKNIAQPVRVYGVWLNDAPPLALPDKPSIAVLPFENLSGDPKQEYFADGVAEDILTELTRFSDLFVIARNSSFRYKGKAVDLRQVGRELGVRYVLEGSIRRGGDRVRISAQLIDCGTGAHRWAERYDRELKDVFTIQDEVARTIAAVLAAHVNKAEAERTLLKPPTTWQAYDHYMRAAAAWALFQSSWKLDQLLETRRHLADSLKIDPKYARAYSLLASTHRVAWLNPVNDEYLSPATLDRAIALARTAIELAPNLPEAYAELAYNIIRKRDFDAATVAAERAIALNANFADYRVAQVFYSVGQAAKAIEIAKTQMRLDPFHPHFAPLIAGIAYYLLKEYQEAQRWLREATGRAPNHQYGHAFLAAAYAQVGRVEDARAEAAEVLRVNPKYTIGKQQQVSIFRHAEDVEHLIDGLRKAGLPE
jgi:TolB-like protein/tetratricopeptide (TPR) repeat protein